jgi:hypothetical protein
MELAWYGRPKISIRVLGPDIIVTMPGTRFRVMYTKTEDNKLVASGFSARKLGNEERQVSFPHFLALAWPAANDKAKQIGGSRKAVVHDPHGGDLYRLKDVPQLMSKSDWDRRFRCHHNLGRVPRGLAAFQEGSVATSGQLQNASQEI